MRYPKKLSKRADEILAARRQTAQERHRSAMAALNEQHPEINAAGRELARLYAQRARASLTHDQDTSEMEEAIRAAQSRRAAALAAAGVTEADLEPAYTCPLCRDRGVKEGGQMCECRQVILNQLVYEQLCDVSPARECSFENFELRYYDEKLRPIMRKVVESSQRYIREFGGQNQSLLFTGAPGLGKTHLSLAIAEGVAKAGHLVMYVSAPHLMDQLELGKFHIQTLQPDVKNKYIKFNRRHKRLLEQLTQFPMGAHDDGPDALEGARSIAKRVKRFRIVNRAEFGI